MAITAVIGGQWGDEGKGKIVDLLSRDANMVARFQGGANAGADGGRPLQPHAFHGYAGQPGRFQRVFSGYRFWKILLDV